MDIKKIPLASVEMLNPSDPNDYPDNPDDKKVLLAQKLEAQGKHVICVGRALMTIERVEDYSCLPEEVNDNWGTIKITIYSDPDVSGSEEDYFTLYIDGGRWGLESLFLESGNIKKFLYK